MDVDGWIGKQVGNYVVDSLLGKGGMGAVYLARHPEIDREVAIKVLAPDLTASARNVERFVAEAKVVARIEHDNVIAIYDFGVTDDGALYYVMERLRGGDLAQVIHGRAGEPFSAAEVLPYLEQIGAALACVHGQGLVHRDLKPANIFVLDREPLQIKVLDFGLVKLVDGGLGKLDAHATASGSIVGTPLTIAPEQARAGEIGPAADIYSLGVVLFWMLAGRPPFQSDAPLLLLAHHLMQPPPSLLELVPGISPAIAELVDRCLAKEPSARPASAAEVVRQFREACDGHVGAEAGDAKATGSTPRADGPTSPPEAAALEADRAALIARRVARSKQALADTAPVQAVSAVGQTLVSQQPFHVRAVWPGDRREVGLERRAAPLISRGMFVAAGMVAAAMALAIAIVQAV